MRKIFFLLILMPGSLMAQKKKALPSSIIAVPCSEPGTVPSKAIPVCGTTVFTQNAITDCQGPDIAQSLCPDQYTSGHSFWYKFTCFTSGSLEFLITPNLASDDYDWVLFDVTGHNPDDVFTDPSMVISINGAYPTGTTGCGPTGINNAECFSSTQLINRPENILAGNNYLLMVTNYTNSGAGYGLSFGGTAVISDGAIPGIDHIEAGCSSIKVFFTTDIKCSSVTPTGSEFSVGPGTNTITGITSDCSLNFLAITSLTINLLTPLSQGNYTLAINTGTDGNTFRNVCDNEIPVGTTINFSIQRPVANYILPPETCLGSAANFVSTSNPLPGNTVSEWHWNFGDPASGAANTSTLQNPTHIFSATGNFLVQHWIVNSLGCISDTSSQTVSIIPLHNIALNTGNPNPIFCINTVMPSFTLVIGGGATGIATPVNLPQGITATLAGNIVSITGTPTVSGVFNYTITTSGNTCLTDSITGTITVTADATLSLSSAAGTNAQELCKNATITDITYDFGGTATGATVTGLPTGVTWSVSGNMVTITGTPTVSSLTVFTYTVSTLGPCVKPSLSGTILVNHLPTAAFTFTIPGCETRVISFTDGSTPNVGALDLWTWDFGDGTPTSALQNPTHVYTATGSYTVTLSVRNTKGCISNPTASAVITINNRPNAGFIIPEVCLNDTYAQFLDTSKLLNATLDRWDWDFGDLGSGPLNVSNLQNPQHSYTATGNYTVRLIVWNNAKGCRDTITQTITVNGSFPVADFIVNNPTTLCSNDSVSIVEASTVFPGSITKVEMWFDDLAAGPPGPPDILDNFPVTGKVYRHLYPNFQTPLTRVFTIRYRAYSGGVCVNDKLRNITVNAAPLVQFNNMPAACLDAAPFQITQASEIGGVPGTGVFNGPGITPGGIFDPASVGPGTYTLMYTFTSTAAGCVDTMSNSITVLDSASARFTYSSLVCEKSAISFNSTTSTIPAASGTIVGWTWNFGDPGSGANNTSTLQNPSHTFSGWGNYNVTLFVTTSNGCKSTFLTIPVFVNPQPKPNFSTPPSSCLPTATVSFTNSTTIADGTQATLSYLWDFGDPGRAATIHPLWLILHMYIPPQGHLM